MQQSKIGWTQFTHNFWTGCQKVSTGCKYCYMHRIYDGKKVNPNIVVKNVHGFDAPTRVATPQIIFTCSMSDFFIKEADQWRDDAWKVIKATPQHTWLILTKRPERIAQCLPLDWGNGYPNVWLGVTVEDQQSFSRVETLAKIPASIRFISAEPLLEEVDLLVKDGNGDRPIDAIDWVILGGESGNDYGKYRYRYCMLKWLNHALRDVKDNTGAAVFVKQLGTYLAKKHKLKDKHGADIGEFPQYLKVQEMPVIISQSVGKIP
jgi:protein gp37